ncbi:hypothetical protein ABPG74_018161 [Tetrahymena malaccensis]
MKGLDLYPDQPSDKWNKRIAYYFDETIGCYNYANGHPMKPLRVAMTDTLVRSYEIDKKMNHFDRDYVNTYIRAVNEKILTNFHSDEYIELIQKVHPNNKHFYEDQLYRFNFGEDCPVLDRLYDYCLTYAAGSVAGANLLANQKVDIALNWSGGLHHAKQSEASGFCYINDCVLAILELLKVYQRVLYIDIDIHHGDGVEEAFYLTDRVMTCSFHKYKDYFPGTGHLDDIGTQQGKFHAVNFPLNEGLDDESFVYIMKPVLQKIMDSFRPEAVVLQCGADSLSGDRLGCFNLSIKGHGECARFMKSFGVPIILLGGGGYTLRNVPRCWVYETSVVVNEELQDQMPQNEFLHYFGPEYKLHMPISNMENQNSKKYLEEVINKIKINLNNISPGTVHISNYSSKPESVLIDASEIISAVNDLKEEREDKKMDLE